MLKSTSPETAPAIHRRPPRVPLARARRAWRGSRPCPPPVKSPAADARTRSHGPMTSSFLANSPVEAFRSVRSASRFGIRRSRDPGNLPLGCRRQHWPVFHGVGVPDDVRLSAKVPLPESVAEDNNSGRGRGAVDVWVQQPSRGGRRAQLVEPVCRHERANHPIASVVAPGDRRPARHQDSRQDRVVVANERRDRIGHAARVRAL